MTDEQIIRSGETLANKGMEVVDDLIQALIAALSNKSSEKEKEVLEVLAEYVKDGGELYTTACDKDAFELFEEIAKREGLTYYAGLNQETGVITIITKDQDAGKLVEISKEMAERGEMIMHNPQLPVAAYTREFGNAIVYANVDSYEHVEKAKSKAAELGAHFAVARKNDGSYMILTNKADVDKLREAEVIPKQAPAMIFAHQSGLQDVLKLVRDRRRREQEQKEMEKEQKKNRGRE